MSKEGFICQFGTKDTKFQSKGSTLAEEAEFQPKSTIWIEFFGSVALFYYQLFFNLPLGNVCLFVFQFVVKSLRPYFWGCVRAMKLKFGQETHISIHWLLLKFDSSIRKETNEKFSFLVLILGQKSTLWVLSNSRITSSHSNLKIN